MELTVTMSASRRMKACRATGRHGRTWKLMGSAADDGYLATVQAPPRFRGLSEHTASGPRRHGRLGLHNASNLQTNRLELTHFPTFVVKMTTSALRQPETCRRTDGPFPMLYQLISVLR